MTADVQRVIGVLHRCRRLRVTQRVARTAAIATAAGLVACLVLGMLPATARLAGVAPAGLAVLVIAAVVVSATWRVPSIEQVAALLDVRLDLRDRAVAALAATARTDAISALVLRDACLVLRGRAPADAFPWRLQTYGPAVLTAAIAGLLLVWPSAHLDDARRGTGSSIPSGAARATNGAARETRRDGRRSPSTPAGTSTSAAPATAPAAAKTAKAVTSVTSATTGQAAQPSASARQPGASSPRRDGRGAEQRDGLRTASREGSATTARTGSTATVAPRAAVGAGSSSARTGGTGGGALTLRTDPLRPPASTTVAATGRAAGRDRLARGARDRVERAIARDEIPPTSRQYVRDYFLAIARAGTP